MGEDGEATATSGRYGGVLPGELPELFPPSDIGRLALTAADPAERDELKRADTLERHEREVLTCHVLARMIEVAEPAKDATAAGGKSLDERALAVFFDHKEWGKKQIAAHLKCHVKSLTPRRCPKLNIAMKAYHSRDLPSGSKSAEGDVEAW